jgi:hypothetical protein
MQCPALNPQLNVLRYRHLHLQQRFAADDFRRAGLCLSLSAW